MTQDPLESLNHFGVTKSGWYITALLATINIAIYNTAFRVTVGNNKTPRLK